MKPFELVIGKEYLYKSILSGLVKMKYLGKKPGPVGDDWGKRYKFKSEDGTIWKLYEGSLKNIQEVR